MDRSPNNPRVLFLYFLTMKPWKGRKPGKRLSSEKKIANPPFCRYIVPAFLSYTIYQRAGVRVVE